MSILNLPSDGLFNILIVLTRALVKFGNKGREELLRSCGSGLGISDTKLLSPTLNRWTELGLFAADGELVAISELHRKRFSKDPDSSENQLPQVVREIAFAPENNARFWETDGNKAADLSRGLSWLLAQDIYQIDTSSHQKIADLEGSQVTDKSKRIFQNDTRWNGLKTWMPYLGFARNGAQLAIDPTEAVRDVLPEVFGRELHLPALEFVSRVAERLPVLDGGSYRAKIESELNRQVLAPYPPGHISTSLSRAIQRLDRERLIATDQRSDSDQGVTLIGNGGRTWRTVTHVRKPTVN